MNFIGKFTRGNLTDKAIVATFWVFSLRIFNKLLELVRKIVLARLLSPNDFGLMGIAFLTITIVETFTETGFQKALIQRKDGEEKLLNAAWSMQIIRGLFLFVVLYILTPSIVSFFEEPQAFWILRVIGIKVLIDGFNNIGVIYFQKNLNFKMEFFYRSVGVIISVIVGVVLAFMLRNVWALVFSALIHDLIMVIMSYVISPYKPKFDFSLAKWNELFIFGRWMLGSSIVYFITVHGDDLLLARLLGTTALGFYQMAYQISNIMATEVSKIIGKVAFPVYSKVQDNIIKLKTAYIIILKFICYINFPATTGILLLANNFVILFMGEQWLPIIPPLYILVISGLIRSLMGGSLFIGVGKPDLDFKIQLVRAVFLMILVIPLTLKWDMMGTAMSVLLSLISMMFLWSYYIVKIVQIKYLSLIKVFLKPLIGSIIIMIIILLYNTYVSYEASFLNFSLKIILGVSVYCVYLIFLWKVFNDGPISIMKKYFN